MQRIGHVLTYCVRLSTCLRVRLRVCLSLSLCLASLFLSPPLFLFLSLSLPTIERSVAAPHGHSGGPPQLCPAPAPARRARGRRYQRLPDGTARCCPLWSLQGGQAHRGQEGQPERQGSGKNKGVDRVREKQPYRTEACSEYKM